MTAIVVGEGLESFTDAKSVLSTLSTIASESTASVLVSVPNAGSHVVGLNLAVGRWYKHHDISRTERPVRLFTGESLDRAVHDAGLHVVERSSARLDVNGLGSPSVPGVLSPSTSAGRLYRSLRDAHDPYGADERFVWLCLPGPRLAGGDMPSDKATALPDTEPFLSVVIRTQGKRSPAFRECLLSLAAQTTTDFEVLVMGHNLTESGRREVESCIRWLPGPLHERVRLIEVQGGGRPHPLNVGFDHARGQYCAVLDDDDFVLAHWVETFASAAAHTPGTLVRARCAVQSHSPLATLGRTGTGATSGMTLPYETEFSLASHLVMNQTPFMSVAFPRFLHTEMNYRFDETLSTTEDWDYLLRTASVVGVTSSPEVTAVYRRWESAETSYSLHVAEEWQANQAAVDRKIDGTAIVLQAGEVAHLRRLVKRAYGMAGVPADTDSEDRRRAALLEEAILVLSSRRWRYTRLLRLPARVLRGRKPVTYSSLVTMTADQLAEAVAAIRSSRSWKVVPTRRMSRYRDLVVRP